MILVFSLPLAPWLYERFVSSFDLSESSNVARMAAIRSTWELLESAPFAVRGVATDPERSLVFVNAHNNYFQVWAEYGIWGLIAFVWFFWIQLSDFWYVYKYTADRHMRALSIGCLSAVVWMATHNLFDIFTASRTAFFLFITFAALASGMKSIVKKQRQGRVGFGFQMVSSTHVPDVQG
jgi:O-antigen ligase